MTVRKGDTMVEVTSGLPGSKGTVEMGALGVGYEPRRCWVRLRDDLSPETSQVVPVRFEFLEGVALAFDVTIIENSDLPTATLEDGEVGARATVGTYTADGFTTGFHATPGPNGSRAEWHRAKALAHLAIARYLEDPPVDKEALAALLAAVERANVSNSPKAMAEILYHQGVRMVSE